MSVSEASAQDRLHERGQQGRGGNTLTLVIAGDYGHSLPHMALVYFCFCVLGVCDPDRSIFPRVGAA